jgi:FAD synthetase
MATGVFDLLHPGHVYFLREARKLGDELVVVVARDSTARRFKHEPITSEESRLQIVDALKPVDRAVLGHEGNIYDILDEIRPDIIVLGFDQIHSEARIVEECRRRGLRTDVVRLPRFEGDLVGTRKIVKRVGDWLALQGRPGGVAAPRSGGDGKRKRTRRKRRA